jgi:hypothetical protein
MIGHAAKEVADLKSFALNGACSVGRFGRELLQLEQLGSCQDHADPIIQIMYPLPQRFQIDFISHRPLLYHDLLLNIQRLLHYLIGRGDHLCIGLIAPLECNDFRQLGGEIHVG